MLRAQVFPEHDTRRVTIVSAVSRYPDRSFQAEVDNPRPWLSITAGPMEVFTTVGVGLFFSGTVNRVREPLHA